MIASTRRGVSAALLGLGLLALGPISFPLRAATPPLPLPLPEGPMRLTRVLRRSLDDAGAAAITVRRWWEITFQRQARGIIVSGTQGGAEVTAPPALAQLARIEEQRDASALLPLMLADTGTIMSQSPAPKTNDSLTAALRAAEALIASQPLAAEERARIRFYLGEVQRAGATLLDELPGDLLFPSGQEIDRRETVALPDGLTGQFALRYSAQAQPDAPWLARAERRITTAVGDSTREALEIWSLGAV